ncbi:MAG: hypothetical protein WBE92_01175 [Steroidobacteraceae bacterium]
MAGPLSHRALRISGWAAVLLVAMLTTGRAAAAQPADQSAPQDSHPLQEVQVTASKLNRRTIKRITMQFLRSHAAPTTEIHQISRWWVAECPRVAGLQPAAEALVSRRVEEVARSVGAPTWRAGRKCRTNIGIVFTSEPQQLLNEIAKVSRLSATCSASDTTFIALFKPGMSPPGRG